MSEHARLGASGAYRWMACPGSVQAESGIPDQSSPHSFEGTKAHEFAEHILRSGLAAADVAAYPTGKPNEFVPVDDEMRQAVAVYTDYVQADQLLHGGRLWVEHRVSLGEHMEVPEPMFGTVDAALSPLLTHPPLLGHDRELRVYDLKYGRGVFVHVADNPQPLYYALGMALGLGFIIPRRRFVSEGEAIIHIAQPRMGGKKVRVAVVPFSELWEWGNDELMPAARRTQEPDAPLVPGEHCRFCKAAPTCPALQAQSLAMAQSEFGALALEKLTPDELGSLLHRAEVAEMAIKAVREFAHRQLETGGGATGYKLIAKRATRKWSDKDAVAQWAEERGVGEQAFRKTLLSPAQMEKAFGQIPQNYVISESSGTRLARDKNPAPAIDAGPGADFDFEPLEEDL